MVDRVSSSERYDSGQLRRDPLRHRPRRRPGDHEGFWLPPIGRPSLGGSPGPSPLVSVRLPAALRERAVRLARWQGSTVPEVLRQALEQRFADLEAGRYGVPQPGRRRLPDAPWPVRAPAGALETAGGDAAELAQAYADGDAGLVAEEE